MKNKVLPSVVILLVSLGIFLGFSVVDKDPNISRTQEPIQFESIPLSPAPHYVAPDAMIFEDSLNGANDTTALKSRGYLPYYRGTGPQGTYATWFQGTTPFPAFNGPSTGYVAANFNVVTSTNNIDSWLISPPVNVGAGDTLSFYERAPTGSSWPDSMRIMYSAVGSTTPEGTWVELGRFKNTITGSWFNRIYTFPTAGNGSRFALRYCVVNGGPSGSNSNYIGVDWIRVYGSGGGPSPGPVPEILYYKFDESQSDSTENFAIPGGGTPWAPVPGLTLGGTGQFGGALQGNGLSSTSNYVNTGWAPDLGSSSWTTSMWLNVLHSTTALNYLWGDPTAGSWRCFYSGAAGLYGVLIRLSGSGGTDITIPGVGPGPTVLTIVYDSAAGVVKAYKNGVFSNQQTQAGTLNISGSGPYKVGGYSSSSGLNAGGLMDEFRFYRRALDTAEISLTWNQQLPLVTGGITPVLNMPDQFSLSQNYPNPFNPTTTINFKVPVNGLVTLKVYDVTGKEVATLINEVKNAGTHSIEFNATDLSSGIYFYRIAAGDFMDVKKMVLLK